MSPRGLHVAIIGYPQYPHLGPVLPIASVLVRRGYRVTVVTSDRFSARVSAIGAQAVNGPRGPTSRSWELRQGETRAHQNTIIDVAIRTVREVEQFYEKDRPQLIIYDGAAVAGRILAKRWGIPAILTSPLFTRSHRMFVERFNTVELREQRLAANKEIDQFLSESGIEGSNWFYDREKLNIHLFPRDFEPCPESIDETCFHAGRCAGEQAHYGEWNGGSLGRGPTALVSTSTTYVQGPEYFKMCIEALSALQMRIVLSVGDLFDRESLGTLPRHCEIVQHVSHVKIFPHVDVLVCLGGIITSAEAAYHGVPMIVTSLGFRELEYQALNLVRLGIAFHLSATDTSVTSIRRAAAEIGTDAEVSRCVRDLQHTVREAPGAEEAANRIEAFLGAAT